jgi:hypothetical protein
MFDLLIIKKNNIFFTIVMMAGLHYVLNPAESPGAPNMAILTRVILAVVVLVSALLIGVSSRGRAKLIVPFVFIVVWFLLINFPGNFPHLVLLYLFLAFSFFVAASMFAEPKKGIFICAFDWLLFFWVSSLGVQILLYFFTSQIFDMHQWLHPLSESRIRDLGLVVRFTGVHIEPGTYASWVYGVVFLRGLVRRDLFDRLNLISVASIFLTFSAWGSLAAISYLLAYYLKEKSWRALLRLKVITVLLLGLGLSLYVVTQFSEEIRFVLSYFSARASLGDESGAAKLQAYSGLLEILLRVALVGVPLDLDFCHGCISPQDAGIFFTLVARGGLLFSVVIFSVIFSSFFRVFGLAVCLALIPLLFVKYFYFEPLFWTIFGYCCLQLFSRPRVAGENSRNA